MDVNSNIGIPQAAIKSEDGNIILTDDLGKFQLETSGIYTFVINGYHSKTMTINNSNFIVVQLQPDISQLNEVLIDGLTIAKPLKNSVASVSILNKNDIELGNDINISQVLNRVPGVYMQSGALNTNRLTIRGIGSRNLFGTSKIRAYFKDIPLTNGSGETTIEDFELNAIAQVKISKGITSSSYGAGLGGTIQFEPINANFNETAINTQLTIGSFNLIKSTTGFSHGNLNNTFKGIYSNTSSENYRANNRYNRQTLTLNTSHYFGDKNEISFLGSFVNLKAFIPSSLNVENFNNNPSAAASNWQEAQGFEDTNRGILGITWTHDYNSKLKQVTSVFSSYINSYEPRPFNILQEKTFGYGLRSRVIGRKMLWSKSLSYTLGGEYFRDRLFTKTFQNLYQDFPENTGSVEGANLSDFKEIRSYFNLFFDIIYHLSDKLKLELGTNYNETNYILDDRFMVSENNPDQSGNYSFKGIFSPKLGLSYTLSSAFNFYANVSHGFSPISLNETLLPNGQINTNLKPEEGWNYEIGSRGSLFNEKLRYQFSIYRLDVQNLVVARRVAENQFVGLNAGRITHDGLELELTTTLIDKKATQINGFFNMALNDYKFKTFLDDNDDFSGNDLTGVPEYILNAGLDINLNFGLYGNINYQYVGEQPITDANTLYSDQFNVFNCKLGYRNRLFGNLTTDVFVGVDNIFNTAYASQILINASSFGGNLPRYFYPGNPANYYLGFNLNYLINNN